MNKINYVPILMTLLFSFSSHAYQAHHEEAHHLPSSFEHYGSHMVTTLAAELAIPMMIAVGAGVGFMGDNVLRSDAPVMTISGALSGFITSLVVLYKIPNWTDKHILDLQAQRTRLQKLIGFFSRVFMPGPIGPLVGELLVKHKLYNSELSNA